MSEEKFSLERKTEVVYLDDQKYTIVELDGDQRDKYLDNMNTRMDFGSGTPTIKRFEGLQAFLLSLCLKNPQDQIVPLKEIQAWPSSVISALFKKAQVLSGLDDGAEAEAKND